MYLNKLNVTRLAHCPVDQFVKTGDGMNAGFDIRAAEDTIIYPKYLVEQMPELGLVTTRLVGKFDELSPDVQEKANKLLELQDKDTDFGIKLDEDKNLYQIEYKPQLVRTGIIVGHEILSWGMLVNRSSVGGKQLLSMPHSVGVIDFGYKGPKDELLISFTSEDVRFIKQGDRIAQYIPMQQYNLEVVFKDARDVVDSDEQESRGGFGSTGYS